MSGALNSQVQSLARAIDRLREREAEMEAREAEMEARIQQLEELLFEKDELEDAE